MKNILKRVSLNKAYIIEIWLHLKQKKLKEEEEIVA